MQRLECLGANFPTVIRKGYFPGVISVLEYVKNFGDAPGTVTVSAFFKDPNQQQWNPQSSGSGNLADGPLTLSIMPGETAEFWFTIKPAIKGFWLCRVNFSGDVIRQHEFYVTVK